MNTRKMLVGLLVACVSVCLSAVAEADIIGYWQMDDAAPGTTATTIASEVNNALLQGTASGATRVFNADVPGVGITDGLGGPAANSGNTASLQVGGGGGVDIPFDSLLEPTDFTIEFFMKADEQKQYPGIVEKPKNGGTSVGPGVTTWGVGKASSEQAFIRVDSTTASNRTASIPGSTADGQWHHFAMTYDSTTPRFTLYRDYTLTAVINGHYVDYDGVSGFGFGNGPPPPGSFYPYNGLMDEVRFSNTVLQPSEFLRAVPEPSTLAVWGLGLVCLAFYGWRRRGR